MIFRSNTIPSVVSTPTQHYPRKPKKLGKKKARLQKEAELYSTN